MLSFLKNKFKYFLNVTRIDAISADADFIAKQYSNPSAWEGIKCSYKNKEISIFLDTENKDHLERYIEHYSIPKGDTVSIADICNEMCEYMDPVEVWNWSNKFDTFISAKKTVNMKGDVTIAMKDGSLKAVKRVGDIRYFRFFNANENGTIVRVSNRRGEPINTINRRGTFIDNSNTVLLWDKDHLVR